MRFKLEIEWPDELPMNRIDLDDKLSQVLYEPDKAMSKKLKPGNRLKDSWTQDSTSFKWKVIR